jgi:hypothetical protein
LAAGASIGAFLVGSLAVYFFIIYRRRVGSRRGMQELGSGDSMKSSREEMDNEGKYWRNMLVRTVTDKRLELPAGKLTPVPEEFGNKK